MTAHREPYPPTVDSRVPAPQPIKPNHCGVEFDVTPEQVVSLSWLLRILTGDGTSEIATVISTLTIAALFLPVHGQLQAFIDRRFYRRKYDAAHTLQTFSATLRDEVDLGRLAGDLERAIQETMQPAHISLWLRPTNRR